MKKFLSLVLALVMTMSLVTISAGAKDFTDNSKITYKEAVDVVSALKIVDGYEDGAFNPTNTLTRGAAAKIICNLILGPTTASALSADTAPYKDVPTTNNFAGYIAYCAQQGIISGYADGTFRPAATLTGYAFMKMLLGALGYDAENEGYTGANWSVQVGKQAIGIGLDDGNDDFVGTKAVTREEACLYAFNTLQATMVEYENQSSIVIGDITVNTSSKAKEMANSGKSDSYINDNGKMEFAEKYFTDLRLKSGNDSFARPANVWSLKSVEIGTYAKTADATYTAKVENGDVYKDLGLGNTMDKADVTVYVNGEEEEDLSVALRKGGDTKIGESANGVLTEVFYDKDDGSAIITQVKTYVGEISKTVKATDKKDAYVEVITSVNGSIAPAGASGTEKFETNEEFDDEAYVLYTFSIPDDEVKSVALAETVTGNVSKVVNKSNDMDNSKVTLDSTEYKASATMATGLLDGMSVSNDYTIYLDAYGYVITVDEEDYGNYALVTKVEGSAVTDFGTNRAILVFTDGTLKTVDTAKNYYKTGSDKINDNTIVTYKENSDGEYILKPVKTNKVAATKSVEGSTQFRLKNDVAKIEVTKLSADTAAFVYGNSKTAFVLYSVNDVDFTSYTGVKNAPSVAATSSDTVDAYWYCKSGSVATVMFIFPKADTIVTDENNDMLFLAKESASDLIHDSDGDYYEYQAVVKGEIKTVKVDDSVTNADRLNGLYSKYRTDSKTGFITYVVPYTTDNTLSKFAGAGVGTDRNSADYTVIIKSGTNADTWTVDDDAKFYEVDEDGKITTGSYGSVNKDDDDKAYFLVEDGVITYLFIEEVDTKNQAQPATVEASADPSATVAIGDALTLTADVTLADTKYDRVEGYQWYKDKNAGETALTDLEDVLDNTNTVKISGATSKTYKVPTDATETTGTNYYCVVTTYNDKVDGKDTAQAFGAVKVTITTAQVAPMTVTVRYILQGTGADLADSLTEEIEAPKTYTAVEIEGYNLLGADSQTVSFTAGGSTTVTFRYEKKTVATEYTVALNAGSEVKATVGGEDFVAGKYADGTAIVLTISNTDQSNSMTYTVTVNGSAYTEGTVAAKGEVTPSVVVDGNMTITVKTEVVTP